MSDVTLMSSPPEDIRTHRDLLLGLAGAHGMTNVRLTPAGRLLVTLDDEHTYLDIAALELVVEERTGLTVEIIPDGVLNNPGHPRDLDAARQL